MKPILVRLLLLLLLGVDWATDPWHGTLPQSQILGSTEVVCHSLEDSAELARGCASDPSHCMLESGARELVGCPAVSVHSPKESVFFRSGIAITYLFMSILC